MESFNELPPVLLGVAAIVLGLLAIVVGLRNRDLQRRNDSLSEALIQVVRLSSEERLSLTRKHADEREKLRTECMLQLDAMQRNITASFTRLLAERLSELRPRSRSESETG